MYSEFSAFAKECPFSEEKAVLTIKMFRDREETKPVQLRLVQNSIEIEFVWSLITQDGIGYGIKLDLEVKFTLLR